MVRRFLFRIIRTCSPREQCNIRNLAMLTMVAITFWIFPLPKQLTAWLRRNPEAEQNTIFLNPPSPEAANRSLFFSSNNSSRSTILPLLSTDGSFKGGYLSQGAPNVGTGQGNLMFMYASLMGIADHAKMTPVYPDDGNLRKIFHISASTLTPSNSITVNELKACAFDSHLFALNSRQINLTVVGYLQSWKYFSAISDRIRRDFTFNDAIRNEAQRFLASVSTTDSQTSNKTVFIGVHIRRRDMLADFNVARGYTVATKEYLVRAVQFFQSQFPSNHLIYVVCGDDLDWARKNFPSTKNSSQVVFSENRSAAKDMAILAACNHSIITVGTYGWWSAYLTGGRTVYYKDFPAPGTQIANIFDKNDYFPTDWIEL